MTAGDLATVKADLLYWYTELDTDKSGEVTVAELQAKVPVLVDFFKRSDKNNDDKITWDEFWSDYKKENFPNAPEETEEWRAQVLLHIKMKLKKMFDDLDTDKSGTVTMGELYGVNDDLLNVVYLMDKDRDSRLSFDELWAHYQKKYFPDTSVEKALRDCFSKWDKNGDGFLSVDELKAAVAKYNSMRDKGEEVPIVAEFLSSNLDRDGDGRISVEEFMSVWREDQNKKIVASELIATKLRFLEFFQWMDKEKCGAVSKKDLALEDDKCNILFSNALKENDQSTVTFDELWELFKERFYKNAPEETADWQMTVLLEVKKGLKQRFDWCDKDHSGHLTMGELYGVDDELLNVFYLIDTDQNYEMTFDELWNHYRKVYFPNTSLEKALRECFAQFDKNGDGFLTEDELIAACEKYDKMRKNNQWPPVVAQSLTPRLDKNKDGKVSIEEFLAAWRVGENKQRSDRKRKRDA